MKIHLSSIAPTHQDIVRSSVFALCLVALGNMYQVINYYIFQPAGKPAPQSTHDLLVTIVAKTDAYQPTQTVVTFLFWALMGLILLAVMQGGMHTLNRVAYLKRASAHAKRTRQPRKRVYMVLGKQLVLTSLSSFMALSTALFIFAFFVLCIVPVGVVYTRIFLFSPTPFNLVYALMGLCLTFIGLVLATVGVRLIAARRRLIRLT
jgi:hypothetical protein